MFDRAFSLRSWWKKKEKEDDEDAIPPATLREVVCKTTIMLITLTLCVSI